MSTVVTVEVTRLYRTWDQMTDYPSAVFSGSAPDQAHKDSGGFHCSPDDLRRYGNAGDYSDRRWADVRPQRKNEYASAAVDMSMNTTDMIKCWNRVFKVWENRRTDTRAYPINAFNGWNGVGAAERLDFDAGTRTIATSDHKWHNHLEIHRMYVDDPRAIDAILSILRGETHEQWLGRAGGGEGRPEEGRKRMFSVELKTDAGSTYWVSDGQTRRTLHQWPNVERLRSIGPSFKVTSEGELTDLAGPVLSQNAAVAVSMTEADREAIATLVASKLGAIRFDAD